MAEQKVESRKYLVDEICHEEPSIRLSTDFSSETLRPEDWADLFKVLKEKTVNQESCIQQNFPSKVRERLRYSQRKAEGVGYHQLVLQEMLKGVLQGEKTCNHLN